MKRLLVLGLLSSAGLLCCAAPAVESVVCTGDGIGPAASLTMQHINKYHRHGYKFRFNDTLGHKLEKTDDGCNVELHLGLLETKCHVVNPTPFEDCPLREHYAREVMANCSVEVTVKSGEAKVVKYLCDTEQVLSNREMVQICPDCPVLIPLNSTEGLKSVHEAVKKFNENTTHQHYYILKEVGRISSGYIMMSGMNYYAEFALVETSCPVGSRIVIEACKPLCPDRAHHAFCRSSYSDTNGLGSLDCEFYPPLNTTAPGPGEKDKCQHPHHSGHHDGHGHDRHGHGHDRHGEGHGHHGHGHDHHGHGHDRHGEGQGAPPQDQGQGQGHGQKHRPHGNGQGQGAPPNAHGRGHGPPPNAHGQGHGQKHSPHGNGQGQGPPPHAHDHGHGPPPHADCQGPPPHAHGHGPPPGHGRWPNNKCFLPCRGLLANADPALHPICPWPFPEPKHKPKPSQS
ncbi:hypothetical protein Q5P01_026461 [Channa striata]|uniref:Cystatin domain-containing protein n=1 Tax=Channa striata TaxID=64152 RepID=A0AA88INS2_CHASR|nr:hypothetical protein Q5P01_026461 [Channa striata]